MVFKKNMRDSLIFLITISLLLLSCSTKNIYNENSKLEDYKPIYLNIFDYKFLFDEQNFNMPNFLGFENNFLIEELTEWGNKKFKVTGTQNSLSLIIEDFSLKKKSIKKYKGLKKILFSEEKVEYNLKLELALNFSDKDNSLNNLNLNGNISFFIDDSHSINKKRKFLLMSYRELIKKIDQTLKYEIEKKAFSKFRTTL